MPEYFSNFPLLNIKYKLTKLHSPIVMQYTCLLHNISPGELWYGFRERINALLRPVKIPKMTHTARRFMCKCGGCLWPQQHCGCQNRILSTHVARRPVHGAQADMRVHALFHAFGATLYDCLRQLFPARAEEQETVLP